MQYFLGVTISPRPPVVFGTNQTCLSTPVFARILPNMQYFPNHWSIQILFISGIGPDTLMNVLEQWNMFLIWTVQNFYLKQKQRFLVRSFTENVSFISFHKGIGSRYLETNKLQSAKIYLSNSNKNTLKCKFQRQLPV